jgi:predicted metal-dependent enzyme (double-stranded beta helix superfamily)
VTAARFLSSCAVPLELGETELGMIAEGLARTAHWWPDVDRPSRRTRDLMVVSEDFEAWVVAWPSGGSIELHDHGEAVGAVVVAKGQLVETVVSGPVGAALGTKSTVLSQGSSISFGATHVHDIINVGPDTAVSVHVYAPRLTSETFYEITDGRLEVRETVHYRLGEVVR